MDWIRAAGGAVGRAVITQRAKFCKKMKWLRKGDRIALQDTDCLKAHKCWRWLVKTSDRAAFYFLLSSQLACFRRCYKKHHLVEIPSAPGVSAVSPVSQFSSD